MQAACIGAGVIAGSALAIFLGRRSVALAASKPATTERSLGTVCTVKGAH